MRTFIAIEIPPNVKQGLQTEQKRLRELLERYNLPPVLRWTNIGNLHLTLQFLGETQAQQRRRIQDGLAGLAAAHQPFTLSLSRLGCFRSWNNLRVLWVGIDGDAAALRALQADVESFACSLGFDAGRQPFSPHVTLARAMRNAPRPALRAASEQLRRATADETPQTEYRWSVRDLYYIRSVLGGGGPQYSTLARCPLDFGPQ